MTLNTVKPRSVIRRLSRSTVSTTDLLLCLVMIPAEDFGLSSIRAPMFFGFKIQRLAVCGSAASAASEAGPLQRGVCLRPITASHSTSRVLPEAVFSSSIDFCCSLRHLGRRGFRFPLQLDALCYRIHPASQSTDGSSKGRNASLAQ